MFKIILFNPAGYKRSAIVARAEQYMDALIIADAFVETLEDEYGNFYHRTHTICPREYQVIAEHPTKGIKVSIEMAMEDESAMSSTFAITSTGEIVHRVSDIPFAGLCSLQDDEALDYLIKNEAYHLIQPKMCKP